MDIGVLLYYPSSIAQQDNNFGGSLWLLDFVRSLERILNKL